MQREIKFRAWDEKDKEMFVPFGNGFEDSINDYFKDDKYVFMQYTGLKDKNGVEIYEGDLLKISMQGDIQTQPFQVENLWDLRIGMENNDSYMRIDYNFEVIGNIYQNPDLIK